MESVIATLIEEYASTIWLSFVTLVVTTFVLSSIKSLVQDISYYIRARWSDIGYNQRVLWQKKLYTVGAIKFKHIELHDEKTVTRIPIKLYIDGAITFPKSRHLQFFELKSMELDQEETMRVFEAINSTSKKEEH